MKKIACYFDPAVKKIFVEKVDENGEKKMVLSSTANFVGTSEIVARIIDINEGEELKTKLDTGYTYYKVIQYMPHKAGEGIYFDEISNCYKASNFGFVIFKEGTFELLPICSITRDKLKAYYNIYPTKFGKIPAAEDIKAYLQEHKILAGLSEKVLNDQLSAIEVANPKLTRIVVAQAKEPVEGIPEHFIPLMNLEKKAGEIKADGRMDFREIGSIIQVVKGQELLERVPEVNPVDGYNIYGDKIPAEIKQVNGYLRGENVVQSGHDENIFLAGIDGCVKVIKNKVSVLATVIINGDVDYETGNVEFNGSVHVMGSVLPGFSIKAEGDVIIENTVEDAFIETEGNITVKMGVVGKEQVRLKSGASVYSKYFLNAKVEAADEIVVEDSIINCDIFSNNRIVVEEKQGKIIGGHCIALYEIVAKVIGAPNETTTKVAVGRNLFIEKELARVQKCIKQTRDSIEEVVRQLRVNFGEGVFENPKEYLKILPDVKKKNLLVLLKELNESNKSLQELNEEAQQIQEQLVLERDPCIIAKDKIYPGVILNIKKSVRKINKVHENVKFYEDAAEKIIRFLPAV